LHELLSLPPEEALSHLQILDSRWDAAWREANPDMVKMITEGFGRQSEGSASRGSSLQLEARRHHDTADRLFDIRCPTLVCGGRYDGIAPPANLEFLAGRIPGARLELFDGGHLFFIQDPAGFPAMLGFLEGH
jgi:3-oxoadipate enol-lactonase